MLLISPADAAIAIGAKCGGASPDQDDPALIFILNLLTAKVEAACNVFTLTNGDFTERFNLLSPPTVNLSLSAPTPAVTLRLVNGFVDDTVNSVVITDSDGVIVSPETYDEIDIDIDKRMGLIHLSQWIRGAYTVTYTAGFEPTALPDPEPPGFDADLRVLQNIPSWMKIVVVAYLVQWYRTVAVSPKIPKDLKEPGDLSRSLERMLYASIYSAYQRPRVGCVWGDSR